MKCEYAVIGIVSGETPENEATELSKLGLLGWELVSAVVKKHKGKDFTFFYFKRMK